MNTDDWGSPNAYFPGAPSCNMNEYFGPHNIVINLTFCALRLHAPVCCERCTADNSSGGDWAGNTYSSNGCPGSCTDHVDNKPLEFTDAYFDFAWIKVYT